VVLLKGKPSSFELSETLFEGFAADEDKAS